MKGDLLSLLTAALVGGAIALLFVVVAVWLWAPL